MPKVAGLVVAVVLAVAAPVTAAQTGRQLLDQAKAKTGFSTWRDRTTTVVMQTFIEDTLARTREMRVTEQSDHTFGHRAFLTFLWPRDIRDSRFLHLSPLGDHAQQWLWAPSTRRSRRLGDAQRDENFLGSDLTYRDIELLVRLQQWNDDDASVTLIGDDVVDDLPAHVLEVVPRTVDSPYTRYLLWLDKAQLLPRRADVYDGDDEVMRRVTLHRYMPIGSYHTPLGIVVSSPGAGTRTVFKVREVAYDMGVPDGVFTVANLDRGFVP